MYPHIKNDYQRCNDFLLIFLHRHLVANVGTASLQFQSWVRILPLSENIPHQPVVVPNHPEMTWLTLETTRESRNGCAYSLLRSCRSWVKCDTGRAGLDSSGTVTEALPFKSRNRFHYSLRWEFSLQSVTQKHHTRGYCLCAKTQKTNTPVCTAPRVPALPPLCPGPQTPVVGHVSLRDSLPPLQVDPAPAAALRHYFWHNRHRRHLRMGRGRGREDPLRQYVGRVPRQERCVGAVVPHAVW